MRVEIIAVGRARAGPERLLFDTYAARIRWPFSMREIEEKRRLPPDALKAREGELLLAAVPDGAATVALDERGDDLTSEALARRIEAWANGGCSCVAFLVGGAEGLSDAVRARADLVLALGRQTWPHMLVRGMLAEQLYRAQQIIAGHPYHRGRPTRRSL